MFVISKTLAVCCDSEQSDLSHLLYLFACQIQIKQFDHIFYYFIVLFSEVPFLSDKCTYNQITF